MHHFLEGMFRIEQENVIRGPGFCGEKTGLRMKKKMSLKFNRLKLVEIMKRCKQ